VSQLAYLFGAAAVSAVGILIVWLRHRKPKTMISSIREFQREMGALGGQPDDHRRPPRGDKPDPILPAPEQGDLERKLKDARRYRSTDSSDQYGHED
jgi:hypothetical protein